MSLIDASYFVKKLNIPNSEDAAVAETIVSYINQFEPQFLIKLFGYPLYKAYLADKTNARFTAIFSGAEYADANGYTDKWPGLIEVVVPPPTAPATTPVAQKQSIIANYVYFYYRSENATQFTGIGEAVMSGENTTMVSPRKKLALIWNEMSNQVKQFTEFMTANQTTYPEWTNINRINAIQYFKFMNPIF